MDIKIKIINEKAVLPTVEANNIKLSCIDLLTEVGRDGRLVIIYRTGISITVPTGYVGVLVPTRLAPIYSLDDAAGLQIFNEGYDGEIIGRYKVNTTSVPSIFEEGEEFAKLIFVPILDINLDIEEYKKDNEQGGTEVTTEEASEPTTAEAGIGR